MARDPEAFLSYTRVDDEFFGGAITSLRKTLELGVQVAAGETSFKIFQDVDGIELGENWQKRVDELISATTFLIPVLTPCFFRSNACRSELEKFITHEQSLKRDDLILPIYFVTAPILEKRDGLDNDRLASEINKRQRYDWRSRANLPINDPQVRGAVLELSQKIAEALFRTHSPAAPSILTKDTFAPELAIKQVAEMANIEELQQPRKTLRKRILWVDDRPNNNIFERGAMEAYNIDFELALSTGEALAKIGRTKFDAIISDMGRPPDPRAGYTLLQALRASGNLTPYFIYAGSNDEQHRQEALSHGAQGSTNIAEVLIADVLKSIA
ncbi:MAG: TIR domain-containing protein [Hyphomicrobiales bacterium]|nr:TIR domain-containing protein [Hyphomicrobiales bacterium]MBV8825604.1 TIR domain-containing protein [Hyphomicrobiales bacterium]MBV9427602.1 TIR domain-containing protein [Bradyrhizobiaceae bacterium]